MTETRLRKVTADLYEALSRAYSLLDSAHIIVAETKKAEYEAIMRQSRYELGYCEAYQLHIRPR